MCKPLTLEQLHEINHEKIAENKRKRLSVALGFCPVCGSKIISQPTEILDKPKRLFFGLLTRYSVTWDKRDVCSKDKSHYEVKENYSPDYR